MSDLSVDTLLMCMPGGAWGAGGAEQRAASWYFLLFQYQGKAEQLLQADNWQLFREFMGPHVGSEDMATYIGDLFRPGALSAGARMHPNLLPQGFVLYLFRIPRKNLEKTWIKLLIIP